MRKKAIITLIMAMVLLSLSLSFSVLGEEMEQLLAESPQAAFEANPAEAMKYIEDNPEILKSNPEIAWEALYQEPEKTAAILDKNPDLATKDTLDAFDDAVAREGVDAMIKGKPNIASKWLKEVQGVTPQNSKATQTITNYDQFKGTIKTDEGSVTPSQYQQKGELEIKENGKVEFSKGWKDPVKEAAFEYGDYFIGAVGVVQAVISPLAAPSGLAAAAQAGERIEEKKQPLQVPSSDALKVNVGDEKTPLEVGKEGQQPKSFTLMGEINVDQGDLYLEDVPAVVNNVMIVPGKAKKEAAEGTAAEVPAEAAGEVPAEFSGEQTNICLNKEDQACQTGSYALLDEKSGLIKFAKSEESEVSNSGIILQAGNPYISMGEKDYLSFTAKSPGTSATLQNRGSGITPLLSYQIKKGEKESFSNGYLDLEIGPEIYDKTGYTEQQLPDLHSLPVTLTVADEKGASVLGPGNEPQKVVFDEFYNYVVVPQSTPEGQFEKKGSWAVSNHLYAQVEAEAKRLGIETIEAEENLPHLLNELGKIPPNLLSQAKTIKVISWDEMRKDCSDNAAGCSHLDKQEMVLTPDFSQDTIYHESAHFQIEKLREEAGPNYKKFVEYQLGLEKKYGKDFLKIMTPGELETLSAVATESSNEKEQFEAEWAKAAGPIYTSDMDEEKKMQVLSSRKKTSDPVDGCFNWYGCTKINEDYAVTAARFATKDPGYFKPYMTPPGKPGYDQAKYDERFRKKLELAKKYNLITPDVYNNIIKEIGE